MKPAYGIQSFKDILKAKEPKKDKYDQVAEAWNRYLLENKDSPYLKPGLKQIWDDWKKIEGLAVPSGNYYSITYKPPDSKPKTVEEIKPEIKMSDCHPGLTDTFSPCCRVRMKLTTDDQWYQCPLCREMYSVQDVQENAA